MTSKEALESLRISADMGDCNSEAVETVANELAALRSLLNRVIDAGVTRWHEPGEEMELVDWLEMSPSEYEDWVRRTGIFSGDAVYNLNDDEAVMRAYGAVRKMIQLRIGDRQAHAQCFRDVLNGR